MVFKVLLPLSSVQIKKVPILNLDGSIVGEAELPPIFNYPVRKDLIRRAFLSAFTARIQPKSRDSLAGRRRVGESWGIGYGLARVPRLDNGRAVFAPMTKGGRVTHPPRKEKVVHELVNRKERVLALISALAATSEPSIVKMRGHIVNHEVLPVVVVNDFESIAIASEAKKVLKALKVWDDVMRAKDSIRIRAGKGKMRGRKYKEAKSLLVVVSSKDAKVIKALRNMPGVDVVSSDLLSILHLAPGATPGRLMVITLRSLETLSKRYEVIAVDRTY